ncbi:MAG: hypothetical protein HGA80_06465, partial [Candidatus Omnitrophica bacterium]|nr:hypothetical protein [Candidatus Omnitrophota bacterium]
MFDFVIDEGQSGLKGQALTNETTRLVKYFLAGLAVPDKELWVNLSPAEQNRIMAENLSHTDAGRDMLAQDYILKQITSTLMYPEKDLGRRFWDQIYSQVYWKTGQTEVPLDAFNKVWIKPDSAEVYQHDGRAFITKAHLKVMLESDYMAAQGVQVGEGQKASGDGADNPAQELSRKIMREVILPVLEREVNEGKNFIQLRQIFYSLILSGWYKQALKETLLGRVYADSNKVKGIDIAEQNAREKVYTQYMDAYRQGVYNYVKEEFDQTTHETLPRKYFSGGLELGIKAKVTNVISIMKEWVVSTVRYRLEGVRERKAGSSSDADVITVFMQKIKTRKENEKYPKIITRYDLEEVLKVKYGLETIEQSLDLLTKFELDLLIDVLRGYASFNRLADEPLPAILALLKKVDYRFVNNLIGKELSPTGVLPDRSHEMDDAFIHNYREKMRLGRIFVSRFLETTSPLSKRNNISDLPEVEQSYFINAFMDIFLFFLGDELRDGNATHETIWHARSAAITFLSGADLAGLKALFNKKNTDQRELWQYVQLYILLLRQGKGSDEALQLISRNEAIMTVASNWPIPPVMGTNTDMERSLSQIQANSIKRQTLEDVPRLSLKQVYESLGRPHQDAVNAFARRFEQNYQVPVDIARVLGVAAVNLSSAGFFSDVAVERIIELYNDYLAYTKLQVSDFRDVETGARILLKEFATQSVENIPFRGAIKLMNQLLDDPLIRLDIAARCETTDGLEWPAEISLERHQDIIFHHAAPTVTEAIQLLRKLKPELMSNGLAFTGEMRAKMALIATLRAMDERAAVEDQGALNDFERYLLPGFGFSLVTGFYYLLPSTDADVSSFIVLSSAIGLLPWIEGKVRRYLQHRDDLYALNRPRYIGDIIDSTYKKLLSRMQTADTDQAMTKAEEKDYVPGGVDLGGYDYIKVNGSADPMGKVFDEGALLQLQQNLQ